MVGLSDYDYLDRLPHSAATARELSQNLPPELFAGSQDGPIESATTPELQTLLRAWFAEAKGQERLFIYWSGHGSPGHGGVYLATKETPLEKVAGDLAVDPTLIASLIADAGARKALVVIDACFSGVSARTIVDTISDAIDASDTNAWRGRGVAVLASAHPMEQAQEGYLTDVLTSLLKSGCSEYWSDEDQFIDFDRLHAALEERLDNQSIYPGRVANLFEIFPNPRYQPGLGAEDVETRRLYAALADGVEHFAQASRGIEVGETGWYFTGRTRLLRELVEWLHSGKSGLRIVTGPPGAGKSAVLGRIATLSDKHHRSLAEKAGVLAAAEDGTVPDVGIVDVSIHAKGKTLDDCVRVLCDGLEITLEDQLLLDASAAVNAVAESSCRIVVLVDALDEAASGRVGSIVRTLIRPLAQLPNVLLLVGSRRSLDGRVVPEDEERHGRLIEAFGRGVTIHDLEDEPSGREDIETYVRRRLETSKHPHREQEVARAVREVAQRADGSFLYARVVSRTLQEQESLEGDLPTDALDAFVNDLHARFPNDVRRVDDLLNALAWGLGRGLTRRVWAPVASALAHSDTAYTDADVSWVLANAGWHIIEAGEDGQAVYRLAHQAFTDHHQERVEPGKAHGRIVAALTDGISRAAWLDTDRYLWRQLPQHASIAGRLDELMEDPGFLIVVEPARLLAALNTLRTETSASIANIYRRVAETLSHSSPVERMLLIHKTAVIEAPTLASKLEPPLPTAWLCHWAQVKPTRPNFVIGRHEAQVDAVALGEVDGRCIVVSGGNDGTVRLWNAHSGAAIGEPLEGHDGEVVSVELGEVDGQSIAVSGGYDGTVRLWNPYSGAAIGRPLEGHDGRVYSVALGKVDGRSVVASGGGDGTVRLWDPHSGATIGRAFEGHVGSVRSVAFGEVDGRSAVVSGGGDGTVRSWDAHSGAAIGEPLEGHVGWVRSVAFGKVDARSVVVSGGDDGTVRLWDAYSGAAIGQPLERHNGEVRSVAFGEIDGRSVAVSSGDDGTVRLWDAHSGAAIWEPLKGYDGKVLSVTLGKVDGRSVVVSGADYGAVRLWDVHSDAANEEPFEGHAGAVKSVALGEIDGRSIVVSGGGDGTVRLWDAHSGAVTAKPLQAHVGAVQSVALGEIDGRPILVSGGEDGAVRLWDTRSSTAIGKPLARPDMVGYDWAQSVALGKTNGRSIVVSGHRSGRVKLWDAHSGAAIGQPLEGTMIWENPVALGEVDGRSVVVSGGDYGTVRLWDVSNCFRRSIWGFTTRRAIIFICLWLARFSAVIRKRYKGHDGPVQSVALGEIDGRSVVVSGGRDGTVRLWDARAGAAIGDPLEGHDGLVHSVALGEVHGRSVVISGGGDGTVRIWPTPIGSRNIVIDIGEGVLSIARPIDNMTAVGTHRGLFQVELLHVQG